MPEKHFRRKILINIPENIPSPPVHGHRDDEDHYDGKAYQNGDQEVCVDPEGDHGLYELVVAPWSEVLAVGGRPEVVESVLVGRPEGQVTDAACEAVASWEVTSKTNIRVIITDVGVS